MKKKQRAKAQELFRLTVPLVLTLCRLLLAPFIFLAIFSERAQIAILLFVFASITDVLDGYIARRYNLTTKLGSIIDPLADKVVISATIAALVIKNDFPFPVFVLFLIRDVLIVAGGAWIIQKRLPVISPTRISKLTTFFQISSIIAFFLQIAFLPVVTITSVLTILSGIDYAHKFYYSDMKKVTN